MVWIKCHGHWKNRKLHRTESDKPYIMERKSGGGVKRLYLTPSLKVPKYKR